MTMLYEVTVTALNLRASASGAATVLTVLRRGQLCHGTGEATRGWLPVTFDRYAGFVASAYVHVTGSAAERPSPDASPFEPSARPSSSPTSLTSGPDVDTKLRDRAQLHPSFRALLAQLTAKLAAEQLPFGVYEAYRTPERQAWLYTEGRTRAGKIVTRSEPWRSFHQYGMAADLALLIDGTWSWNADGELGAHWKRLGELAAEVGLRTLSFEKPHVELPVTIADATGAAMLAAGDDGWRDNLEAMAARWQRNGGSGAPEGLVAERPALPIA